MIKHAIIWKESVYKSGFHCNKCGTELADKNGNPHPPLQYHAFYNLYRCGNCGNLVASGEEIEVPDDTPPGLYGNYDEFKKGDIEIP